LAYFFRYFKLHNQSNWWYNDPEYLLRIKLEVNCFDLYETLRLSSPRINFWVSTVPLEVDALRHSINVKFHQGLSLSVELNATPFIILFHRKKSHCKYSWNLLKLISLQLYFLWFIVVILILVKEIHLYTFKQ
jgi:hypothetical protein